MEITRLNKELHYKQITHDKRMLEHENEVKRRQKQFKQYNGYSGANWN
jgi:hypothetical protein